MNNEPQLLIDEAYKNYLQHYADEYNEEQKKAQKNPLYWMEMEYTNIRPYPKEDFIDKCKTDSKFSEKWGLTIEERELSLEERVTIWNNTHNPAGNIFTHNQYDENDIPKRAISLRYNHKTITSYE